ncbi:MAG: hypothetical protein KDC53_09335 [Saprospiraceae bacterium]|nr:hypothetical protein [Saprospiraceae bacterium]
MKRIFAWFFAIYFILGSLSPYTDFGQFWHIASALEHFKVHRVDAQSAGLQFTIWTFIRDHYINPDSHQHNDVSDHESLPAKHIHQTLDLIAHYSSLEEIPEVVPLKKRQIVFINATYSFLFNPGIDRPPSLI